MAKRKKRKNKNTTRTKAQNTRAQVVTSERTPATTSKSTSTVQTPIANPESATPKTAPSHKKYCIIAVISVIIIIMVTCIALDPILRCSKKCQEDFITNSIPSYFVPYYNNGTVQIDYWSTTIGTVPDSEPSWIVEGLELAKSGDTSEKALFASRYAVERLIVEDTYDYLWVLKDAPFDRKAHWEACVWVIGEAYFNRPEGMKDEVYELLRPILVDLVA